ncbi:HIT family protein [Haloferula sargassicola]|uniref:HIT domain-containing protein n=1 Tax=Haloferula sargassicola TaxID=490096 RepID=A0ABP9USC9_9BACT
MEDFSLHPRLAAGSHPLGRLDRCRVLLKDHARFPWILIVPEVPTEIEDLHQLDPAQYLEVMALVRSVSEWMVGYFQPTKLNFACIGNQVRQMHLHLVARREDDPAWPGTVWAYGEKQPYEPQAIEKIITAFRTRFSVA